MQYVRQVFDLMPRATLEDWEEIAARAALVPQTLSGYEDTLTEGRRQGLVAAERQAVACAQQADVWGGVSGNGKPFFLALVDELEASSVHDPALVARLTDVADRATRAYASLGRYLVEEYLPDAAQRDAVGPERYARWAAVFNGIDLDLATTYDWGWEELHRIEHAMGAVADRILPGQARRRRRDAPRAPIPTARSRVSTRSARGCRTCSTRPSSSSTACTSTSPRRSGRSRR